MVNGSCPCFNLRSRAAEEAENNGKGYVEADRGSKHPE